MFEPVVGDEAVGRVRTDLSPQRDSSLRCRRFARRQQQNSADHPDLYQHSARRPAELLWVPSHQDTDAHNTLGSLYVTKGNLDKAVTEFQEAIRLLPSFAGSDDNLGLAFHTQNRENGALSRLRQAVAIEGQFRPAGKDTGRRTTSPVWSLTMGFWYYFWTANFLVAGSAFVIITLVVVVRGSKDLREMFARLKENEASRISSPHERTK